MYLLANLRNAFIMTRGLLTFFKDEIRRETEEPPSLEVGIDNVEQYRQQNGRQGDFVAAAEHEGVDKRAMEIVGLPNKE